MLKLLDFPRPSLRWLAHISSASLIALGLYCSYRLAITIKHPASQAAAGPAKGLANPPAIDYRNHAMAAASEHLFGAQSLIPITPPEAANSPYTISGIVCTETTADSCDPTQPAAATLDGPGGPTVVQAGSRLANGDTVQTIQPMGLTVESTRGTYKLGLTIPMASASQLTSTLQLDGAEVALVATGPVHSAAAPPPADTLNANLLQLQAMLQEARDRNRAASPALGKGSPAAPPQPPPSSHR